MTHKLVKKNQIINRIFGNTPNKPYYNNPQETRIETAPALKKINKNKKGEFKIYIPAYIIIIKQNLTLN